MSAEEVFECLHDRRLARLVEQGEGRGLSRADATSHGIITLWKLDRLSAKKSPKKRRAPSIAAGGPR